jgi:hypothetical protein
MAGSYNATTTDVVVVACRLACASVLPLLVACGGGGGGAEPGAAAADVPAATAMPGATTSNATAFDAAAAAAEDEQGDNGLVSALPTPPEPGDANAHETAPDLELDPDPDHDSESESEPDERRLSLESGESVVVTGDGQTAVLQGPTVTASAWSSADAGFDVDPGRLTVQYQGGDESERVARVVGDPDDTANHVLEFLLRAANVRDAEGAPQKGRIQLNAYATESVRAPEIRMKVRMKLADGFEQLRSFDRAFRWLTLSEWWNDAGWTGQAYPFRITLDVTKPAAQAGARLFFAVRAETLNVATRQWDTTVWSQVNTAVPVPTGRWVTLEYHFREGGANEGRFYLAMVPDGGTRVVLFDQRGWTHHPDNPAPDGLTHLNPVKLYTSKALIEHAAATGHPLRVHWDDIGFRLCRRLMNVESSPCGPAALR